MEARFLNERRRQKKAEGARLTLFREVFLACLWIVLDVEFSGLRHPPAILGVQPWYLPWGRDIRAVLTGKFPNETSLPRCPCSFPLSQRCGLSLLRSMVKSDGHQFQVPLSIGPEQVEEFTIILLLFFSFFFSLRRCVSDVILWLTHTLWRPDRTTVWGV